MRDDGPGIPPDKIERIFEAYYTTKEHGTGLGLAIVKHNVELYGGTVRVESGLGKGASFYFNLPGKDVDETQEMSASLPPVLVVDDEKNMRRSLQTVLGDEGYVARAVESAEEGLELLGREEFFMVITDARLGGMSGYDFLAKVRQQWPELPVLMLTAYATPKLAVEAIKAGAIDYLAKPFAPEELLHAVFRCAERYRLLRENAALRLRAGETFSLDQIVGESPNMRELRKLIQTVAPTDARVLILGESGTGKELVAGALHGLSLRREAHYIRINCAAIPETLLESELFGHEKGAFTGAVKTKTRPRGRGRRRHDFSRRNRGHEPAAPGQAAAISGGRHLHARRRHAGIARQRALDRRHQPRHCPGHRRGTISAKICSTG